MNKVYDIKRLSDYTKCPMYYFLKYEGSYKTETINLLDKYDDDIKKVIYYSFNRLRDGKSLDLKDIKYAWGKAWIKDKRKSSVMFNESLFTKDTYNERRRKGIDCLFNFYDMFKDKDFTILAVNMPYEINIDGIIIKGIFDTVLENKDKAELVSFHTDSKQSIKAIRQYDLELSAKTIAIEKYLKGYSEIKHTLINLDKNTVYQNQYSVNKEYIKLFKNNIKNIVKAIDNDIYYTRADVSCYACRYRYICQNINKSEELLERRTKI